MIEENRLGKKRLQTKFNLTSTANRTENVRSSQNHYNIVLQNLDRSKLNFDRHLEFESEVHCALLSDFIMLCAPRNFETLQAEAILFFI